jgi:molybdopterin synthase catalytic subunit
MSTQDSTPDSPQQESHLTHQNCHVALTHAPLNLQATTDLVRSPKAGAIVIFAG